MAWEKGFTEFATYKNPTYVPGDLQITSITIDPAAIDPDDVDMLQDMITAAVNEAIRSAQELAATRMNDITGGMNIPGLM